MSKEKFDINALSRSPDHIALIAPAKSLFSWSVRSIRIPPGWSALVTHENSDPALLHSPQICSADDVRDVMFVRTSPLSVAAEDRSIRSSDSFLCEARIELSICISPERDDLIAFRKTLLAARDSTTHADLSALLQDELVQSIRELVETHTAAVLISGLDPHTIQAVINRRVGPALLRAGLTMDGPPLVSFTSEAWQQSQLETDLADRRQRHEETRRQLQETMDASRQEQLNHLLSVIRKLKDSGAKIPLMDLMAGFGDEQRGQLYSALWHLPESAATRSIAAISGNELLLFEPPSLQKSPKRFLLPETLGPPRSIQVPAQASDHSTQVLIGAARGVYLFDLEEGQALRTLPAPTNPIQSSKGGFNAAAVSSSRVFATHSELGLIEWDLSENDRTAGRSLLAHLTQNAGTVRATRVAEGFLWFTVDARLWATSVQDLENAKAVDYPCGTAPLTSICFDSSKVYAADSHGAIYEFEIGDPLSRRIVRNACGGPVESIQVVTTSGVPRLIIADRSTCLTAMMLGDRHEWRYEAGGVIIRRAVAATDCFAAMSDARDRLLTWDPRRPETPSGSVVMPHLTGSTIQDIAVIPISPPEMQT